MVLLKNDDETLPLDPNKTTAVIGPLGDSEHDMLGPWWGRGDDNSDDQIITPYEGILDQSPNATFTQGCTLSHLEPPDYDPSQDCDPDNDNDPNNDGFADAIAAAKAADQVVLTLGETREMSAEAASRSTLDLPGRQEELIRAIKDTGKPFVVVLFNGRPLDLTEVSADSPAILEAWFPGVEAGNAVADVVFGKVNPGGKLPVSFPQRLGQVPIYYNHEPTGRPCDVNSKYNSRYRDLNSCDPLYQFGYGLSYTTFSISNLSLNSRTMHANGAGITATVQVKNTGTRRGDEVVQLYIHDPVASISQPVRRLRDFKRVTLDPGETTSVKFTLDRSDVGFYDNSGRFVVEPGKIELYVGKSSTGGRKTTFTVTR
jgi:beta-glucosidase